MAFPTGIGELINNMDARLKSSFRQLSGGFTLIELLIVMAIIAILLMLISPRYYGSIERSKEAVLKQNLYTLRDVVDKYYADTGRYPEKLSQLVEKKYLRQIPIDPITERTDTWILESTESVAGPIFDIHSGANGVGRNGVPFREW